MVWTAYCLALAVLVATGNDEPSPATFDQKEFDQVFDSGAIRLELIQTGDARSSVISLQEMYEEPFWAESPQALIPPHDYGRMKASVFDVETGRLVCVRRFDTMFVEYATTDAARNGIRRSFEFVVRIPKPKSPVKVVLESRNADLTYSPVFETKVDARDYHIRKEQDSPADGSFDVMVHGAPSEKVDIAYVAEGYTADERDQFEEDVKRISSVMFEHRPFAEFRDRFNVRGVFQASAESGTDEPRQRKYRSTLLNSSFNIFDLDRYLLVEDNHMIHRLAARVPYDTVIVLVNTQRYGGGGICLDYCACTADHEQSAMTLLHEFGHSFANLADEYIGNAAYNDIYPEGVEPVEPNITRQLQRDQIKWKMFLTPEVSLPTPLLDSMDAKERQVVGAFEGGGYLSKGMYRPEQACWMGVLDAEEGYCVVCAEAIRHMIRLHAPDGTP